VLTRFAPWFTCLLVLIVLLSVAASADSILYEGDALNTATFVISAPGFLTNTINFADVPWVQCGGPCPGPTVVLDPNTGDISTTMNPGFYFGNVDIQTSSFHGMIGSFLVSEISTDGSKCFAAHFDLPFDGTLVQQGSSAGSPLDLAVPIFTGTLFLNDYSTMLDAPSCDGGPTIPVSFSANGRSLELSLTRTVIPTPVPEPMSITLALLGLLGVRRTIGGTP
jgi:hypothetical protein